MQEPNPLPWGALDRFQAHFIVNKNTEGSDTDYLAKTVLKTEGHFAAKKVVQVSWDGGRLARVLNEDNELNDKIAKKGVKDATIYVEPVDGVVRIRNKWKNHLDFKITKDLFEIYDAIAGHIKSL